MAWWKVACAETRTLTIFIECATKEEAVDREQVGENPYWTGGPSGGWANLRHSPRRRKPPKSGPT